MPVAVVLTGGEVSNVKGYAPVMAEPGPKPRVLLGDKGYDADTIPAKLDARGVAAIILRIPAMAPVHSDWMVPTSTI